MDMEWEKIFQKFLDTADTKKTIELSLRHFFESKYQVDGRLKLPSSDKLLNFCSVIVSGVTFFSECSAISGKLQDSPEVVLKRMDELLNNFKGNFQHLWPKQELPIMRFRFDALHQSFQRVRMPEGKDAGHIVQLEGTVIKVTSARVLWSGKTFICGACKSTSISKADPEQYNLIPNPSKCQNCEVSGQMRPVSNEESKSFCLAKDVQEIKIQEKMSSLKIGAIPKSIWITLNDDLVGHCNPGDDVQVIGIVYRRWQPLGKGPGGKTEIKLAINANHLQVQNMQQCTLKLTEEQKMLIREFWKEHENDELEGRNKILSSFCPQVYGLYHVKLAVFIVLCGGVEKRDQTGVRQRGESHILLVGDPGTGKSQILRYAAKLTPKSVLTSGIGSTNAGLTVSAIRDGSQWVLESGALVLADGGVCCIDEFGTIKEPDRVAIHEAMEQQCISVAKAGVVTRLQTRCSIIATANPKGRYDPTFPMNVNINIGSPLLSRFDLVFLLLDCKNPDWDVVVSSYILQEKDDKDESKRIMWNFDQLKNYFAYCRQLTTVMSKNASTIISKYYTFARAKASQANMSRMTARFLESCVRLAEGHAKFMNHPEVTICDAVNAITLLELSHNSCSELFPFPTNPLHTVFPENATQEYRLVAKHILTELGLPNMWAMECERLDQKPSKTALKNPSPELPSCAKPPQEIIEEFKKKRKCQTEAKENTHYTLDGNTPSKKRKKLDSDENSSISKENSDGSFRSSSSIDSPSPSTKLSTRDKLQAFKAPSPKTPSSQTKFIFKKV